MSLNRYYVLQIHLILCGLSSILADIHSEVRLDEGCRGLLQKLSSGTDDYEATDIGSGSGEVPTHQLVMWMSVCSKEFGEKEAEVVCRELGCNSGRGDTSPERVGLSRFNITLSDIAGYPMFVTLFPYSCSGSERTLEQCRRAQTTCNIHQESDIVAVQCNDPRPTAEEITASTMKSNCSQTHKASDILFALSVLSMYLSTWLHIL